MESPLLQLKFRLTWWDLLMATVRATLQTKFLWITAFILGAFRTGMILNQGGDPAPAFGSGIWTVLLLLVVYLTVVPALSLTQQKRMAGLEITLDLFETHLRIQHAFGNSEVKWSAIKQVDSSGDALYLGLGPGKLLMVPRRAIDDPKRWNGLVGFCRGKVARKSA